MKVQLGRINDLLSVEFVITSKLLNTPEAQRLNKAHTADARYHLEVVTNFDDGQSRDS